MRNVIAGTVMVGLTQTLGLVWPATMMAGETPMVIRLEVVAGDALVGGGNAAGNAWGGQQTRIVRTAAGVFVAYTVAGSDELHSRWRLVTRTEDGRWPVMAEGRSGREPVNLMAAPDGTLHIIAWPDGLPRLWSGLPKDGTVTMREASIEGPWGRTDWPYNAAGISARGDLALVQTVGAEVPGNFIWGYCPAGETKWTTGTTGTKTRHLYSYVFPEPGGRLTFTATRGVKTELMGYDKAATTHSLGYVYNHIAMWSTEDVASKPTAELAIDESLPTPEFPLVWACGTCVDSYLDTQGRMHVLYFFVGPETKGKYCIRHAIVEKGRIVKTVTLPPELDACFTAGSPAGGKANPSYCRMIQDTTGRFYLIGTTAIIPAGAEDGTQLGEPVPLDLKGHTVEYSGMGLAAPRGGTPLADFVDGVFPSAAGKQVVYVRIRLRAGR